MKTAEEHHEALESTGRQLTDPIASAVVTERERLMTDPLRQWCTQVLTHDKSAESSSSFQPRGIVSGFPLLGGTRRQVASLLLSGYPVKSASGPIPRLDRITIHMAGTFSLIDGTGPREQATERYEPGPGPEPAVTPAPLVGKARSPPRALVKVLPTREKRTRKRPEMEVAPVIAAVPKPLKVIRRRKQEEPKVFETAPRTVPRAMLEGINESTDAETEGQ